MDFLIKSGSIHFKNSLIVIDIVRQVIMFSCILVPTCRHSHFHNLAQWTGDQACSYLAELPTLPDFPGISRISAPSPGILEITLLFPQRANMTFEV